MISRSARSLHTKLRLLSLGRRVAYSDGPLYFAYENYRAPTKRTYDPEFIAEYEKLYPKMRVDIREQILSKGEYLPYTHPWYQRMDRLRRADPEFAAAYRLRCPKPKKVRLKKPKPPKPPKVKKMHYVPVAILPFSRACRNEIAKLHHQDTQDLYNLIEVLLFGIHERQVKAPQSLVIAYMLIRRSIKENGTPKFQKIAERHLTTDLIRRLARGGSGSSSCLHDAQKVHFGLSWADL